jgi:hypothetical protein
MQPDMTGMCTACTSTRGTAITRVHCLLVLRSRRLLVPRLPVRRLLAHLPFL